MKKRIIRLTPTGLLSVLCMLLYFNTSAQVYLHDFGTTPITSYPYTETPTVVDPDITNSSWTNNIGIWTGFTGETGMGLGHANASGSSTITLTFDVAVGKQLDITSFNFWRSRSNVAAQNWAMTINGIAVGSGTIPTVGATIGLTPVANPITELTGTVTVVITLSNSFSTGGFFTLDNFELNGSITEPCTPPVITTIAPASGPAETTVTITGSGFEAGTGTTAVHFNGVESSGFVVISDTEIKAIVPANATTGAITVFTDNCEALTSTYTFLESDCPDTGSSLEIYISELYDANSGTSGAIELYNPTSNPINLTGYTLLRYGDIGAGTPSYNMSLTGSIPAQDTFIVSIQISSVCPGIPTDFPLTNGINGNDEFELLKNGAIIDNVQAPFNKGYTLIRNPDAVAPKINYNSADWLINENESCSNLNMHTAIIANTITTQPTSESICESDNVSFTVTVSNDSGFTYQWKMIDETGNWVNVVDNAQFSGATTNTLTITSADVDLDITQYYCEIDSITCTLISNAVQLTVSPLPVAIIIETQPTCTEPTGSIEATPVIGDDLTYSLDGIDYQTANTFNNLASGNYTVYVQSSAGCISTIPAVINPIPDAPDVATTTITQPTCTTITGTIEVTAPTGAGLEYSINGVDFQTETIFTVNPGTYNITVMNASGCTSITNTININNIIDAPPVAITTVTQPTCTEPNGIIEVTPIIAAGVQYSINGVDFQEETTFIVAPGTYNVTVINISGCTSITGDIIITTAPDSPAVATTMVTQSTCTEPNGTIEITAPIGTGIEYSINGIDFQTNTTFTAASGTYNITVMNADGCTSITEDIVINDAPTVPAVAITTVTQPTCTEPNGTIEITAPIGTGIEYSINGVDFQTNTTFTAASGTYNITVMNTDGCTSITEDIVINDAPTVPAVAITTVTQPTCTEPNGTIEVTSPIADVLFYSINGVDFQIEPTFTVTSGTYNLTVMNANGCTSITGDIVINPIPDAPAPALSIITQPTCTEPNGFLIVTSPLGDGLEYSIDGITFQDEPNFVATTGTYNITVRNAEGCTSISSTINIVINPAPDTPAIATTTVTQPTCDTPTGTIEVTAPTGAGLEYSIDGVNFQTTTTFNVASGTYNVTVMNAEGCTSVTNDIIINNVTDIPTVATIDVSQPTCTINTGTIEVTAPTDAGLEYSIDGVNFQTTTTFNVPSGTYNVTVMNAQGCTSITDDIVINNVPDAPVVTGTQGCITTTFGQKYILEVQALDNSFDINTASYEWKDDNNAEVGNNENTFDVTEHIATNGIDSNDYPLNFTLTITTAGGCTAVYTFTVIGTLCDIPRGISPNNDGMNDKFDLSGLNARKVIIFNRYGKEVYSRNNYINEWEGQTDNGDELPTGTYFYMIETSNDSKTGWVYINRQEN
ncbi:hypothetical protein DVK85_09485 [Flavobacterium arcticum]|uniref:LTD domain-containing protein n=1 Tax=Flavobacterium arcticum TaxID=1784713 RepID=A0A345HCZ3_9FLAO|nr:gliding motility-associated C-terminal domain-containing protein [Flavobacterium arcticum]AXG74453.1 hypothetical protein DVK85_09485 [Flavobacterium arcticum]KAF2512426.1 T9SS type B sorting domain-containing protein [Flavobacterium arcticum]